MTFSGKYDKVPTGFLAGLLIPLLIGFLIYLFTGSSLSLQAYLEKIIRSDIITHTITLSVFPNIFIFLIFNRFDMLNASKGVLAITIIWAFIVFGIKLL